MRHLMPAILNVSAAACLLLGGCATTPSTPADSAEAAEVETATPSPSDTAASERAEREARARAAYERAKAEAARRQAETKTAPASARPPIDPESNYARMKVYYATDRAPTEDFHGVEPDDKYLGDRGPMAYGQAFVSIPRGHVPGELEAPSILRLEFREDPARHVVLLAVVPQRHENFLESVALRVRQSEGSNAFVFVHGYNVSFADAARRTAQMAYDLSFDGAPIFYSWPSQASLSGYTVDESNIVWSTPHIKRFLVDVAENSGADNLYLIGHSMGSRGLTRALVTLMLERPDLKGRFREIILAAPDIDADVFRNDIAPKLVQAGRDVTLYASSNDLALQASKEVHGYPRAGDAGNGILMIEGVDTIDASGVDDSILAHSYFVESVPVIRDIAQMLRKNLQVTERSALEQISLDTGSYWQFVTAEP